MRWRLRRRRRDDDEALRCLEEARAHLDAVRNQYPAVRDATAAMDRHRHENNFAHKIRVAMGVDAP